MPWLLLLGSLAHADVPPAGPSPAWNVDPTRTTPLRWTQPDGGAEATWIASVREVVDQLGVEVSSRRRITLDVARGPAGGRTWTAAVVPLEVTGLSDFGPIDPELLADQTKPRTTTWTTRRDGTVSGAQVGEEGLGEALQAVVGGLGSSLQIPAPPNAVAPGGTWTATSQASVPLDVQGFVGTLTLDGTTEGRFVGWVREADAWRALIEVRTELSLAGRLDGERRPVALGGIGRTGAQVLLDPETGLARWQAVRTRVTLSAGDRRPEVVEQVMVLATP